MSLGPTQIRIWPLPGDTMLPPAFGFVVTPVLKAVLTAERWLHCTW